MENFSSTNKILLYKTLLKRSKIISFLDPLFYDFTVIQIKSGFLTHRKIREKKILKKEVNKCISFLKFLSEFEEFVKGKQSLSDKNKEILLNLLDLTYGQIGLRRKIFLSAYTTYVNNQYITEKKDNMKFDYRKNIKIVLPEYFTQSIEKKQLSNDVVKTNQYLLDYYNKLL